jgi:hypothetical protein
MAVIGKTCHEMTRVRSRYRECGGTYQRAEEPGDWLECPYCETTGRQQERSCAACLGAGWLYTGSLAVGLARR